MRISNFIMVASLIMVGHHIQAQHVGLEYTTELQTNFSTCNFVNLLRLNGDLSLCESLSLDAATISIAKTSQTRLLNDMQTFSNIEEDNLPLAIAVCGICWDIADNHSLFVGVRNMNEDYFTSAVTTFFTNSSCGLYPTISANYPIANYPLASMGIHYSYEAEKWAFLASFYNGQGYNRLTGHDNVFRLCPDNDGIFGLAQVEYNHNGSHFFLGNAIYYNNGISLTPWFYTEQNINGIISLIAGYSHALGDDIDCRDFVGIGAHYKTKRATVGIFTDYAKYTDLKEFATEITCELRIGDQIYIQPITHVVYTNDKWDTIHSLRLGITF